MRFFDECARCNIMKAQTIFPTQRHKTQSLNNNDNHSAKHQQVDTHLHGCFIHM